MTDFLPTPFMLDIIAFVVLAASVLLAYYVSRRQKSDSESDKTRQHKRQQIISCLIAAALSAGILLGSVVIYAIGSSKGMTMQNWKEMRIDRIISTNRKTPSADKLPAESDGHVVILYKYGCSDCEAIQTDLEKAIADLKIENVHWIPTTSEDGKQLIEETHINDVPAVIYMRHEPLANGATTTHMTAYTHDGNDIAVNTAALQRVKLLQEKNR